MADLLTTRQIFPKLASTPGYQVVPTVAAALTTKDTQLIAAYVSNPTAGALTITMTDGNGGTPFGAVSIAANQVVWIESIYGTWFKGGFTWVASAAGLQCDLIIATRIL